MSDELRDALLEEIRRQRAEREALAAVEAENAARTNKSANVRGALREWDNILRDIVKGIRLAIWPLWLTLLWLGLLGCLIGPFVILFSIVPNPVTAIVLLVVLGIFVLVLVVIEAGN